MSVLRWAAGQLLHSWNSITVEMRLELRLPYFILCFAGKPSSTLRGAATRRCLWWRWCRATRAAAPWPCRTCGCGCPTPSTTPRAARRSRPRCPARAAPWRAGSGRPRAPSPPGGAASRPRRRAVRACRRSRHQMLRWRRLGSRTRAKIKVFNVHFFKSSY